VRKPVCCVLLAILVGTLSSCSQGFRLSELPLDRLPPGIADSMPSGGALRAVIRQGEVTVIGWSMRWSGVRTENLQWFIFPNTGGPVSAQDWYRYQGTVQSLGPRHDCVFDFVPGDHQHLAACGVALESSACKAIAETTAGRQVTCEVINGFWYLRVEDLKPGEVFVKVDLVDRQGRVVFTHLPKIGAGAQCLQAQCHELWADEDRGAAAAA